MTDIETPAETLRRAFEDLGRQAERAAHKFRHVMLDPATATALAAIWDALADQMDHYGAGYTLIDGVQKIGYPGVPAPEAVWTTAHNAALSHLGEATL